MIEKITKITGKAIPISGNDIDTDRIIPARFMKCLNFNGLGQFAFYDERFDEDGKEKDHPFNSAEYKNSSILITNRNFGCGSSREHAPWALSGMGIKCIIAQSYAEIFAGNCSSLGIPAIIVPEEISLELQEKIRENTDFTIEVDLIGKELAVGERVFQFDIPETYRLALIEGKWDTTSMLQASLDEIKKRNEELPGFSLKG